MSKLTVAKESLESVGMWMQSRFCYPFKDTPIQSWDMLPQEKGFFTVYTMNLVMESNGFDSLAAQKPEDVQAFIHLLESLGASKTSAFVRDTLAALNNKTRSEKNECTSKYYELFKRDKVWLKLEDYLGERIFGRYLRRALEIDAVGGSVFNPKEWQGELQDA